MSPFGLAMSRFGMLDGLFVVAFIVMFCRGAVGFRGVLVLLRCFVMSMFRHIDRLPDLQIERTGLALARSDLQYGTNYRDARWGPLPIRQTHST
jgi:hypothetical protein